jgi:hypothetical protein
MANRGLSSEDMGIYASTIGQNLYGDIGESYLNQVGQGTADITSKRLAQELALGESKAERYQDWQKALLSAQTTQRGQDLGVTQSQANRDLELAIANLQKDYADDANLWSAGGSILGGLFGNWDSIFG